MADAGMNVARINFSHGTHESNGELAKGVRKHFSLALVCDIQGPRVRLGEMSEPIILERDDRLTLTSKKVLGDRDKVHISYKRLKADVKRGDRLFVNDGIICLQVVEVSEDELLCQVVSGGLLSSNKGVNFPGVKLSQTVPTKKDTQDLKFIAELAPEYVAVSFVGGGKDIKKVKRVLDKNAGSNIKLIAKIERKGAVQNLESILDSSDAIMVARGDLGVETSPERVPRLQKEIIRECNREGKPVIVATQMLESMVFQPVPTRAEANDVFNSVQDGADAVMLSGETSIGKFPVKSVSMMARIASNAEKSMPKRDPSYYDARVQTVAEVLGQAVHTVVGEFEEHGTIAGLSILTITRGGYSARMISKYRPPVPIIAATPDEKVERQLNMLWGVNPILFESDSMDTTDDVIKKAVYKALQEKLLSKEGFVIIACASSLVKKKTNILGVFKVNEVLGHSKT
jgi:pyruvate kinase